MIIDSANLKCDHCGVVANHHVMFFPEGWSKVGADVHYCPECSPVREGQYGPGMKLIELEKERANATTAESE